MWLEDVNLPRIIEESWKLTTPQFDMAGISKAKFCRLEKALSKWDSRRDPRIGLN